MVLGELVDTVERDEARRGEHTALPDAATEHLPHASGLLHEFGASRHHRADGSPESLAEARRHAVHPGGQRGRWDTEGHGGVPDACAVEVHAQPRVVGGGHERRVLVGRDGDSPGRVVGVLQRQQSGAQCVVRPGTARRRPHGLGPRPSGARVVVEGVGHASGQPGGRAQLIDQHVRAARGEEAVASAQVRRERDEIGHRAARGPQRGGLVQDVRHAFLQRPNGRVGVDDVVADLGRGHHRPHVLVGAGERVGTEVEGL